MEEVKLLQQWIVAVIVFIVSLVLLFAPGVKDKWAAIPSLRKVQIIVAVCFGLAILAVALTCIGVVVASDSYCPDFSQPAVIFQALYALIQTALVAAGAVQTLYAYGLKPASNFLASRN